MRKGKIMGKILSIAVASVMVVGLGGLATPTSLVLADDAVVTFADRNIEWAIRQMLDKPTGDIRQSDLERITGLDSVRQGVSDLSGLEYCVNLTTLYLHDNQISDISPLSSLASLTTLYLHNNQISDISALSSLANLTTLNLPGNQISDISPLSSLANLTTLYLNDNQISDISPLSSLANLTRLHLHQNRISDISPLSSLANLTTLELYGNRISDISALSSLTNLTALYLDENRISDLSPLSSLANLGGLKLDSNQICDISPLVDNIGLGEGKGVNLRYNYLDLTPGSQAMNDIQTLQNRGVDVIYEPQMVTPPDPNDVQVGVKAGDWIKIKYTITGLPAGQPHPKWLKFEFLSVEGTIATVLVTMGMSDGTEQRDTVSVNVLAGGAALGLSGLVIPANLTTGDTVYMTGYGNLPIEGETTRTYGGARRSVVHASLSQYGASLTYYWDKQTGVMVEASTTSTGTTATAKATETNMWEANPVWVQWWLWTVVAAVVAIVAGAVYLKRRKMRSGVSP